MLTLLLLAPAAHASAYYFADAGVRSFSRGSAFVAGVDDLSAQYYNPAALTRLHGGHFKADLAFVSQYVMFDRADEPDQVFDPITNSAPPYAIPSLGISHDFGLERFNFAFGLYPPYAPDVSYPSDGPQRYTLVDTTVVQTTVGPSVGFKATSWLSVGAGLQWNLMLAEQELTLTTSGQDDPSGDIGFRLWARDPFKLSANAGVLVEPPSGKFAVGFTVQPPIQFHGKGFLEGDFTNHVLYKNGVITDATVKDSDISLAVKMPLILKGGVLVRPTPALELELDYVWQNWSVVDEIRVSDIDLTVQNTLSPATINDDVVLPAGYDNAFSVRLGAQYDLNDEWVLRAGALYEASAVPAKTQGVGLVDGPKVGGSTGFSLALNDRVTFDAGAAMSFILPREITDSEVSQIKLDVLSADGGVEAGKVVGNGTFESRLFMAGFGFDYRFGSTAQPGLAQSE